RLPPLFSASCAVISSLLSRSGNPLARRSAETIVIAEERQTAAGVNRQWKRKQRFFMHSPGDTNAAPTSPRGEVGSQAFRQLVSERSTFCVVSEVYKEC